MLDTYDPFRRFREKSRSLGVLRTLVWAFVRGLRAGIRKLVGVQTLIVYEKVLEGELLGASAHGVQFLFYGGDSSGKVALPILPRATDAELATKRLAAGHQCVVAVTEGRAVGLCWFTSLGECDPQKGIVIHPDPTKSYGFDFFVVPEYRKARVGSGLTNRWLNEVHSQGRKIAKVVIKKTNSPSIRMFTKAGFNAVERFVSVRLLGLKGFVVARKKLISAKK